MGRTRQHPAKRFWPKVDASKGPMSCWEWTASQTSGGYGRFNFDGEVWAASRWVMYQLNGASLRSEDWVLHKCDNSLCCNPSHLYIGTPSDNVWDQIKRGRSMRGKINASKTHCPRGHAYDALNTFIKMGSRNCRACHALLARERRGR